MTGRAAGRREEDAPALIIAFVLAALSDMIMGVALGFAFGLLAAGG